MVFIIFHILQFSYTISLSGIKAVFARHTYTINYNNISKNINNCY